MSQQGGSPTGHEDDWWGRLYDDSTGDTGPTAAADSLDDRFTSAAEATAEADGPPADGAGRHAGPRAPAGPRTPATAGGVPAPRAGDRRAAASEDAAHRAGPEPRRPAEPGPARTPAANVPAPRRPPGPPAPPPATAPASPPETPPPPPPPPSFPLRSPSPPPSPSAPPVPPAPEPPPSRHDAPGVPSGPPPAAPAAPPPEPRDHVGSGPPTYDPEPTALPSADPDDPDDLIPDTVLEGAHYGACTLRAVSLRGDSARFRGERRRDALLVARFGAGDRALVLVAMATGARAAPGAHRAAAEVCRWIARAVGRSHPWLLADLRAARRGDLKSGLRRLTDRSLGRLRAGAAEQGLAPDVYAATLRCLLLPGDPDCRTRVFFGVGAGGLFRLRDGTWQDMEPRAADLAGAIGAPGIPGTGSGPSPARAPEDGRLAPDPGVTPPSGPYGEPAGPPRRPFRFRASVARPGDVLLMCTAGLAEPLRGEAELREHLARRWSGPTAPGLVAFHADARVRAKGYADDRTAAAVWEA
ncbi:hypothetical protein SUDANB6_01100 [Streptomyces sp. enrichment culture]|uniref:protein phosphatase 2C domain-containing protein n=1 Tax=Streptomyces sp. enrichment culture TaxID=1795815 RepID=UPI003F5620A0